MFADVAWPGGKSRTVLHAGARLGYGRGMIDPIPGLLRHLEAFRRPVLPGQRRRLLLGSHEVGWVLPEIAVPLVAHGARETAAGIARPGCRLPPESRPRARRRSI